jgi:hypothetical protein
MSPHIEEICGRIRAPRRRTTASAISARVSVRPSSASITVSKMAAASFAVRP